ncbi:MAG: hypothetical protein KKD99_13485 [Proteobacteria bacterium]|nr:hypothetical protein [Pseudomonadota bacterium]
MPAQALQHTLLKARGELGSEFAQNRIKEFTDKPYFAALFWSIFFSTEVTLIVTGILSIFHHPLLVSIAYIPYDYNNMNIVYSKQ